MVVTIRRLVAGQHGQDRRHGEHVGHAVPFNQAPGLLAVQPFAREQDRGGAARDLWQSVDAGAVRQRRHHQRDVVLRGCRHQVAKMIADHIIPSGHGSAPRPWGARWSLMCRKTTPDDHGPHRLAGSVCRHGWRRFPSHRAAAADGDLQPASRVFRCAAAHVSGKARVEDVHRGAGGSCQVGNLGRRQPEIGRHPGRADHPGREHCFQHGVGVAGMEQNPVAMTHTAFD